LQLKITPGYFRLDPRPNSQEEHDRFDREDGVHRRIAGWIRETHQRLFYLTGQSGCGKSSIVNAYLPRELEGVGVRWVILRTFVDPVEDRRRLLGQPGLVWDRPPPLDEMPPKEMLQRAAAHLGGSNKRLLLVFDQFEQFFVLEDRQPGQLQPIR